MATTRIVTMPWSSYRRVHTNYARNVTKGGYHANINAPFVVTIFQANEL